jgi:hypothetical protein
MVLFLDCHGVDGKDEEEGLVMRIVWSCRRKFIWQMGWEVSDRGSYLRLKILGVNISENSEIMKDGIEIQPTLLQHREASK